MNADGEELGVKSTGTCFRLLERVRARGGAGVSELARDTGLSKSAVHKHVRTLSTLGFLVREGDRYHLSFRFLAFARQARDRLPFARVESAVRDLAETTDHTTDFLVRENDAVVCALQTRAETGAGPEHGEGSVVPAHATAGGKAVLAYLDAAERDALVERRGLPRYTEKTITDRARLEEELQSVRDRRVAFGREEFTSGVHAVASPVLGIDGRPVGSVSVVGDTRQMSGKRLEEDVVGLVTSAAKTIERAVRTA